MMLNLELQGKEHRVEITPGAQPGLYRLRVDGTEVEADARMIEPGVLSLILNGQAYRCILKSDGDEPAVVIEGQAFPYRLDDPRSLRSRRARAEVAGGARQVKASMPGRVVRVLVAVGDTVEAHQGLVVVEAMKMQNELKAPKAGRVTELRVASGEAVASGQVLAVIE